MEVNPNIQALARVARTYSTQETAPKETARTDDVSFERAQGLEEALRQLPVTRADKVDRAKQLAADANYPPQSTIRAVANLLASNLGIEAPRPAKREGQ